MNILPFIETDILMNAIVPNIAVSPQKELGGPTPELSTLIHTELWKAKKSKIRIFNFKHTWLVLKPQSKKGQIYKTTACFMKSSGARGVDGYGRHDRVFPKTKTLDSLNFLRCLSETMKEYSKRKNVEAVLSSVFVLYLVFIYVTSVDLSIGWSVFHSHFHLAWFSDVSVSSALDICFDTSGYCAGRCHSMSSLLITCVTVFIAISSSF